MLIDCNHIIVLDGPQNLTQTKLKRQRETLHAKEFPIENCAHLVIKIFHKQYKLNNVKGLCGVDFAYVNWDKLGPWAFNCGLKTLIWPTMRPIH